MNEVIPNLVGGLPGVNGIFQIKFPKISNLAVQFFSNLAVQKWIFRTWRSKNVFSGLAVQKWIFWAWRSKNNFFGLGGPKIIFVFLYFEIFCIFDPKLYIEIFCIFVKNLIVLEIFVILAFFLVRICV